jgi:plasmid stabilization system protein ParE
VKLRVKATPRARQQIRKLKAWWRRNREKAPTLLRDELRNVFTLLAEQPEAGHLVEDAEIEGLRFHPVRRTPYLVFYVPKVDDGIVEVRAVWGGPRGEGPDLG